MGKKQIVVKKYQHKSQSSGANYQRDANKMSKKGYKVISTETIQPKSGCLRILALGLFFKPKPFTQVTYELQPDSA